MDSTMIERLDEEYQKTLTEVANARISTDEAAWQLKKLGVLHEQRMSEQKANEEAAARSEELALKKANAELERERLNDAKKDRLIKIVLDGLAIVLPAAAASYWMAKGLTFEQTGTFTSRAGQWLGSHMRLFRK